MSTTTSALVVRPLAAADLPELAAIRIEAFRHTHRRNVDALADYLRVVFVDNPWTSAGLTPLVAERPRGRIAGFLGVIPRPFLVDDAPVTASMLSHFMVRAEERGTGVGRALMQEWLAGPQAFSWSDVANQATRSAMTRNGARLLRLHGMSWTAPVRPWSSFAAELRVGTAGRVARRAFRSVLRLGDRLGHRPAPGALATTAATPAALADAAARVAPAPIRPVYSEAAFSWLLARLADRQGVGPLQAVVARDADGAPAGWFVYFAPSVGIGQVVQVAARPGAEQSVVDALVEHAWQRGVVTLEGRLEPHLLSAMSERDFAFRRRDPSVLAHAHDPALLAALAAGDCFVSRMDGEWWMHT